MLIGHVCCSGRKRLRDEASESPLSANSGHLANACSMNGKATNGGLDIDDPGRPVDRGETRAADYATRRASMSNSIAALFQRLTQGVYVVGVAHGEPP